MPGYLDQYGAGEQRRENAVKYGILGLLLVVICGGLAYYLFKNHAQEGKVRSFLESLRHKDYTGAYRLWGCSSATPCSGYPYDKFLQDWGPEAANANLLRIEDSESCNSGVILTVTTNTQKQEKVWVDKDSNGLTFSPFEICPNKSPLSNMIHQTVGKLRKPFLN